MVAAAGTICLALGAEPRFERLGPDGGTVRSLLISRKNADIVYLGTSDGQLFRSTDAGISWKPLYPGLKRRQLVVDTLVEDPGNPNHIFAGGWDLRSNGGGLFETTDAGASWRQVKLPKSDVAVRGFAISRNHPTHRIIGTGDGVYVTADGGQSWQQRGARMQALLQTDSVAIDPVDPRRLIVGTWHLGYRSADFGKTWIQNDKGMIFDSDMFTIAIDERNPAHVFASACTGLYRSIDHGASWTRLKVFPNRYLVRAQVVYIDPADSERIFGGTTEGLFISRNSGKTWSLATPADWIINAVQAGHGGRTILIGTELLGVLRSEDGGRTWIPSNKGFGSRSIARISVDQTSGGRLLVGEHAQGKAGGLYAFDPAEGSWQRLSSQAVPGAGLTALLQLPSGQGRIGGTARGVFLQKPGAGAWTPLAGPIARQAIYDFALSADQSWVLAGTGGGIFRAQLDDLQFRSVATDRFIPRVFCFLSARGKPDRILAGTHMGIFRSDDAGASWAFASGGMPDAAVSCLVSAPARENFMLAGTTAGLFVSTSGGKAWARFTDGRLGVDISSVIFLDAAGMRVVAADNTYGGVLVSEDGGLHWEKIEHEEFGSPVRSLVQDPLRPATLYLGTASEGVYRLILPSR